MITAAGIAGLLSGTAEAQDGLRSASLPERAFESTIADGRDLFRVPAGYYHRPPDADASRLLFPHPLTTFVWDPYWGETTVPVHGFTGAQVHGFRFTGSGCSGSSVPGSRVQGCSGAAVTERSEVVPEVTASSSVSTHGMTPGEPKTFYVIPGCYAGDRLPALEWLPRGCDISKMRVVPPRFRP